MWSIRDKGADFDLDEFLSRPLLAHIASVASEGEARNSLFWYLWEDQALWAILEEGFNTIQTRVHGNSSVGVGLADFSAREGWIQHVSIRGRGGVEAWDDDRASRLLRRYYRHLDGYVEPPQLAGQKVGGRLPMTFLRIVPESVVMRSYRYRDDVLRPPFT